MSLLLREENRDREKRREERRRERKDKQKEEREQERQRRRKTPSVCRFKTPPCVPRKRQHVLNMRAFSGYTRRRLERTHGGVFSVPHHTHHTHTPHRTTQHHTTPHITNRTHNTTTQRTQCNTHHMRTTMSTHTHHTYTYTYTYTYTHHPHTTHINATPTQSTSDRDLETKKRSLDMCTNAPPTMFLHSIKICNICNVFNFMRTLLFLELISSAKIFLEFFLFTEMVWGLVNLTTYICNYFCRDGTTKYDTWFNKSGTNRIC